MSWEGEPESRQFLHIAMLASGEISDEVLYWLLRLSLSCPMWSADYKEDEEIGEGTHQHDIVASSKNTFGVARWPRGGGSNQSLQGRGKVKSGTACTTERITHGR